MPNSKSFQCPSCGAALLAPPNGKVTGTCPYCHSTIALPQELRTPGRFDTKAWDQIFTLLDFLLHVFPPQQLAIFGFAVVIFGCVALISMQDSWKATDVRVRAIQTQAAVNFETNRNPRATGTPDSTPRYPSPLLSFGGTGTAPGLFQQASFVATDGSGNIYVADTQTQRIQKFDATGKYRMLWIVTNPETQKPVTRITGLSAGRAGNVMVTADDTIFKYDGARGKLVGTIPGHKFSSALALRDGGILATAISNTQDDAVRLDANGTELWYKHALVSSQSDGMAPNPFRVAADAQGNFFAIQNQRGEILKYAPDGKFIAKFGSYGGLPGQFNSKFGIQRIAIDDSNNLYLNDYQELYVLDENGNVLKYDEEFFMAAGGIPRDMTVTPQHQMVVVQNDNKISILPLPDQDAH